jgi:hypothetical protein
MYAPSIVEFSREHYMVDGLTIEPSDSTAVPRVQDHVYGYIQDNIYAGYAIQILLKHVQSNTYIPIEPSSSIELDVLSVPMEMMDGRESSFDPDDIVFLVKPERARSFQMASDSEAVYHG